MELYKANETKGNYTTLVAKSLDVNPDPTCLYLNQTFADDTKRAIYQTLEFRQAVSLAINRKKANDTLFFGLADLHPCAPGKNMPWYDPSFLTKYYTTYDPAAANAMLDKIGLDKKDSAGYRLMKNGQRMSIVAMFATGQPATYCEMLTTDLKLVGIELIAKSTDNTTIGKMVSDNTFEAMLWNLGRATLFGRGTPDFWAFRPEDLVRQQWCPAYVTWFSSGGKQGMEPPKEIKDLNDMWFVFAGLPGDSAKAAEVGKTYFKWFADNMPMITGPGTAPKPVIVRKDVGNFPTKDIFFGSDNNFYHPYVPEVWYRK
jgi:peptide/nickel transport system substrate-binding protein